MQTYAKVVHDANISFTKLGHEECEVCSKHACHVKEFGAGSCPPTCTLCIEFEEHRQRYTRSRQEYRKEADRELGANEGIYSADLMKVVLLPVMPQQACFFTRRLAVYNETFAPLMPEGKEAKRLPISTKRYIRRSLA